MLRGVSQRLSDGERGWEGEKRGLEGQLSRTLQAVRQAEATADQLRFANQLRTPLPASLPPCHALLLPPVAICVSLLLP